MSDDDRRGWFGTNRRPVLKALGSVGLGAALGGSATAGADRGDATRAAVDPQSDVDADAGSPGPHRKNRFIVEIDGLATASFARVQLTAAIVPVVEYRDGNDPANSRRLAGLNDFEPLVLQKGVTQDSIALFEWFKLVQDGKLAEAKRAVAVVLLDRKGEPVARWEFRNAWPGRYDGPNLDAAKNEVALERLEIVHEGMERTQ
jgi:phage tail-like protein